MIIEEGKCYRARNGLRVGPMKVSLPTTDFEADQHIYRYSSEGSSQGSSAECRMYDLVAEWADEAPRNEDPTPLCDLGKHVRGSNDICIACGATPEVVNAQARAAMAGIADSLGAAFPLVDDPANATGTAQMLKDYPGPTIAEALTNERKGTHGNWTDQAVTGVMLDEAVQDSTGYKNLAPYQRKAVDMILVKVSRIVSGDPGHEDHWDDIAGYAYLGKSGHKST